MRCLKKDSQFKLVSTEGEIPNKGFKNQMNGLVRSVMYLTKDSKIEWVSTECEVPNKGFKNQIC